MAISYMYTVIARIAEAVNTPSFQISPDTHLYKDLGIDSLDVAEILCALEDEFNIEIPDEEFENFSTVRDIAGYIDMRVPDARPEKAVEKDVKFTEIKPESDHLFDRIFAAVQNAFKDELEGEDFSSSFEEMGAGNETMNDIQHYTEKYLGISFYTGYIEDIAPGCIAEYIDSVVQDVSVMYLTKILHVDDEDGIDADKFLCADYGAKTSDVRDVFEIIGEALGVDISRRSIPADMTVVDAVSVVFDALNESYGE